MIVMVTVASLAVAVVCVVVGLMWVKAKVAESQQRLEKARPGVAPLRSETTSTLHDNRVGTLALYTDELVFATGDDAIRVKLGDITDTAARPAVSIPGREGATTGSTLYVQWKDGEQKLSATFPVRDADGWVVALAAR